MMWHAVGQSHDLFTAGMPAVLGSITVTRVKMLELYICDQGELGWFS